MCIHILTFDLRSSGLLFKTLQLRLICFCSSSSPSISLSSSSSLKKHQKKFFVLQAKKMKLEIPKHDIQIYKNLIVTNVHSSCHSFINIYRLCRRQNNKSSKLKERHLPFRACPVKTIK